MGPGVAFLVSSSHQSGPSRAQDFDRRSKGQGEAFRGDTSWEVRAHVRSPGPQTQETLSPAQEDNAMLCIFDIDANSGHNGDMPLRQLHPYLLTGRRHGIIPANVKAPKARGRIMIS